MSDKIETRIALTGEAEYKAALKNINAELKVNYAQMGLVSAQMDANAMSEADLTAKTAALNATVEKLSEKNVLLGGEISKRRQKDEELTKAIAAQQVKTEELRSKLELATAAYGENSDEAGKLRDKLEASKKATVNLEAAQKANSTALAGNRAEQIKVQTAIANTKGEIKKLDDATKDSTKSTESLSEKIAGMCSGGLANMSTFSVATGDLLSSVIQRLADLAVEAANKIYEVGSAYETSLAKVSTISGETGAGLEQISDDVLALSDSTGKAAADINEALYNVISSTQASAEESLQIVDQANKMAVGGFTDLDSSVKAITGAMNAYGMGVESISHITDSLVATQNLGVTTVDQLAGSMGKAMSTASAYNVGLENLEAGYVSLTKMGISTEESTTYLSSMLKELGDSGSTVGKIIKEETGKSFGQLMSDGASLGDVISILSDSVNGNGEALMNLWSSAEAGKASNAIVSQGLVEFNENLKKLTETSGTTEKAYGTMADTAEQKTKKLQTQMENAGIAMYKQFTPALDGAYELASENLIPALSDLGESIIPLISDGVLLIIEVVDKLTPVLDGVTLVITSIAGGLQLIVALINAVYQGLQMLTLQRKFGDFDTSYFDAVNNTAQVAQNSASRLAQDFVPKTLKKNARGSEYWIGGETMVGEDGPEVVSLPRGSRIWPNGQMPGTQAGSVTNYYTITIDAKNIREMNDVIAIAKREAVSIRQGVIG